MGTRNLTCVLKNGEFKVAQYGQWDGYPQGQGKTIAEFISNWDREKFETNLNKIKQISERLLKKRWVEAGMDPKNKTGLISMDIARKFSAKYPHLDRNVGASILQMIQDGTVDYVHRDIDFAQDGLFCEYLYVINLDEDVVEVFRGFAKKVNKTKCRFGDTVNKDGYLPVQYWTEVKFSEIEKLPLLREVE